MTTKIPGVYALTNSITNRAYVGSSKDILNRRASHFWQMRNGRHKNHLMQADFDQHGADAFDFIILHEAPLDIARQLEQACIDTGDFGYNLAKKASGGGAQNAHTRERMSKAKVGKRHAPETINQAQNPPYRAFRVVQRLLSDPGRFFP